MGLFVIMGHMKSEYAGDKREMWDPNNPEQVESARQTFEFLVKEKKYKAYAAKADGEKGELITKFDPSAGKIIMAPAMVGG